MLKVFEGHTDSVYGVVVSPDGTKIISGSGDNTVRIWSVKTGEVDACLSLTHARADATPHTKLAWNGPLTQQPSQRASDIFIGITLVGLHFGFGRC